MNSGLLALVALIGTAVIAVERVIDYTRRMFANRRKP